MRTVYATQFRVQPKSGQPTSSAIQAISDSVAAWVTDRYKKQGVPVAIEFDGEPREPKPNHKITALAEVMDNNALITLEWFYPHDPDRSLLWSTQITIAASKGEIEVAVLVRITSIEFAVQPLEYDLGRPRVVPMLLGSFNCAAGACPLTPIPTVLDVSDVKSFVEHTLLNPGRLLPVVVVSPDIWTDKALVDAGTMQDALAGLATVAALKTKWAAYELTEAVGSLYSCYKGAVRIYWPGFKPVPDDSSDHHVFLPALIREHLKHGRPLERHVFRMLASLGAFRFTEGIVISRARAALERNRRAHFDSLVGQAKKGDSTADKELLDLALSENDRLEKEKTQDKERISELESEIANYRANFISAYEYQEGDSAAEIGTVEVDEATPQNVLDALERVSERCNDILVIYKSAWGSAQDSDFARPEDVLKALLAVAELGKEYFASKGKRSMGPWEAFFEKCGLKYASTESQNTLNMYGDDRKFRHEGRRTQMLKHITLGKGDRKNCLQIYFEANEKASRVEIGYCGRHLPYYGQGT